jgi:multidrug efflux pump subunit AcrB
MAPLTSSARWAVVTREDIANTTKRAYDGRQIGLYREKDDLIPIVLRHIEEERESVSNMKALQFSRQCLPIPYRFPR